MSQERTTKPQEKEQETTPVEPKPVEKNTTVGESSQAVLDEIDEIIGEKEKLAQEGDDEKKKKDDEMDFLIDEIDEVLEENAEAFIKNFIQKGGE